jgi:hypothetical protein
MKRRSGLCPPAAPDAPVIALCRVVLRTTHHGSVPAGQW